MKQSVRGELILTVLSSRISEHDLISLAYMIEMELLQQTEATRAYKFVFYQRKANKKEK